jgi:signal transduction histidine kinase
VHSQEQESAFQGLVEAGIALSSELSLDAVLQRLVETAAALTDARYAALGVLDASGKELERFITHGIDPETHAAIGELPRGRGILGVLIRDARPLRLHDIAADDRSVGFPPNHPSMSTFLGVPILLRGIAYGNLYLTEKAGAIDFTGEDEEVVTLLASQAAVAIENARLYASSRDWARQLESLDEITNAMLSEIEPGRLLQLVVDRMSELLEARFVAVLVATADGRLEIAAAHGDEAEELVGERLGVDRSKAGRVFLEGMPVRVDSVLDDPDADPDLMRRVGARAGLWAPLIVREETIGVLMALDRLQADPRFSDADLRLAQRFAARAAVAVDLSRRVARTTVRRIVGGQEQERRRLSRELHDETGQALTSILLGLKAIEDTRGTERFPAALAELREIVVATLQDVRRLAVELRPKALDDFGLVPALERLTDSFAEQTGIATHLESRLPDSRLPSEIETVLYRVVQEALTNVVKHAQAEHVSVLLHPKPGRVAVMIEDDGRGFAEEGETEGIGLLGMRERVALVGGTVTFETSPGAGTTIVVEVPSR